MNWQLVSLDDTAPQPWRNGGGTTRELLAWPAPSAWRVRLSVAEVQAAGPFSRYEGVERWFAVLQGQGVVLRVGGAEHRLTRESESFGFDGGAAVDCALVDGPTRDFNLMAAPGRASMRRVRGAAGVEVRAPALLALYAHAEPAELRTAKGDLRVPAFHLAWRLQDTPLTARLRADDALWMEALA